MRVFISIFLSIILSGICAVAAPVSPSVKNVPDSIPLMASPAVAKAIIRDIMDAVGAKATFEVSAAKIPNAAAASAKGKRYILYNPVFMAALHKATGSNRWAPISILAHEIGHHLNGHTITKTESDHKLELEADAFSGFALRKMGASLEDAQLAIRLASNRKATHSHPARNDRLIAIALGWQKADDQLLSKNANREGVESDTRESKPPVSEKTIVLDDRLLAYDVHFTDDPEGRYHVTVRNNLIKLSGNKVSLIGKLHSTHNIDYPVAVKTQSRLLLVDKKGLVITTRGRKLGYITGH